MDASNRDEEELMDLYKTMYVAMVDKDRSTLDEVLAPTFALTHMTGMVQSKNQYINAILDGTLNYFSARHESIAINVEGDAATLVGDSIVEAAVFGGGKGAWHLSLAMEAARQDGVWRFTGAKASTF